ncbi:MAG: hypothetical protein M1142_03575 [Patescibacteria group bacterium]|nr:hypothetical protein [Patescibacteria group bacterium]
MESYISKPQVTAIKEIPKAKIDNSPVTNQKGFIPLIVGVVIFLIVIAGGAYYLGTQKNQESSQVKQTIYSPQISPTTLPKDSTSSTYIKYQYKVFHLGYPVFEVEVPSIWTAYTTYGKLIYQDPATIYLGEAQNKDNGLLNDIIPSITIKIAKNKQLSEVDPKQWPQNDQLSMSFSSPISNSWVNLKVDGLDAKKISAETVGSPIDIVYFTKDGVIFTISNNARDQEMFEHILSTFKIIDLKYL